MLDESYTIPESLQDEDFDWVGVLTNQIYADDKERVFTRVLHGVSGVAGMRGNKKETLISGINRHDFAYYRSQLGGPWLNIGHNGVTAKQSISTIAAGPEGIFGLSARNNLFVMNEFKEWTKLPWYSEHKCANISTGGTFVAALLTTGDIYLMSDFLYGSDISYKWSIITGGKFRHIVLSPGKLFDSKNVISCKQTMMLFGVLTSSMKLCLPPRQRNQNGKKSAAPATTSVQDYNALPLATLVRCLI